jgi:hypothetical protein
MLNDCEHDFTKNHVLPKGGALLVIMFEAQFFTKTMQKEQIGDNVLICIL